MEFLVAEFAKYFIIILFALYTFYCFRAFARKTVEGQNGVFRVQRILTVMIIMICNMVLIVTYKEMEYIVLFVVQLAFYFIFTKMYQLFYKGLSKLIFNNMMICMAIGFVMQTRLAPDGAMKQMIMAAAAMGICFLVPLFIQRFTIWEKLGWQYAIVGILLLLLVFVIGVEKYGATNWISIGGFAIQPSEFVKIIYVFFIAGILSKTTRFKNIVALTAIAGIHVIILVLEKDLGAALIYFITYLVVLYVATMKAGYLFAGLGTGTIAAIIAYKLFSHVRIRVTAWSDPWNNINDYGYQVCQSLFAIGTGGLFGMGLGQGLPGSVPVVESDFVFAAISEEMGLIFAICLILVYLSNYIMFVNIAMKMKKKFYKFTAFGLSVMFIIQVFLCIGGVTKFVPSTGVTLPLISYGGSSIVTTIIIFSIIQGMYVLNGREEAQRSEKETNQNGRRKRKTKSETP